MKSKLARWLMVASVALMTALSAFSEPVTIVRADDLPTPTPTTCTESNPGGSGSGGGGSPNCG